jgi:transcriptional regulator with XRE-family HTH domain
MTPSPKSQYTKERNVKRIREMLGIKQDDLATRIGLSQQAVSQLENKESLDREVLDKVSKALGVNADAIKNFNEEAAVNYFNSFNDQSINNGAVYAFNSTFNPIEKLMEVMEENKKLYERLLKSESEKNKLLESMLKK